MADFQVSALTGEIEDATFYLIESMAPNNVDPPFEAEFTDPPSLSHLSVDAAVTQVAEALISPDDPEDGASLIIMVHGFNTPRDRALPFYNNAVKALKADQTAIFGERRRRVVCVAYRWPSESIGQVLWSSLPALPILPLWLLGFASIIVLLRVADEFARWRLWDEGPLIPLFNLAWWFTIVAVALLAFVVISLLLRSIVYFRDVYRAINYGVPDLVEVIRQIDLEAAKLAANFQKSDGRPRKRISLSFIGHSMGGLVVTNAIRVLSDVFDPSAILKRLSGAPRVGTVQEAEVGRVPGKIGHVFTLERLVLASPDIPAETLLSGRGNFLASSLRRFREAYLFSNEGDEVLLLVSTIANYFTFPTRNRNYGYRLGNLEILSEEFGEIHKGDDGLLATLRVGGRTLRELSSDTHPAPTPGEPRQSAPQEETDSPAAVAKAFTYFDCTDCVAFPGGRGLLTEARNYKARNREGRISYLGHLWLMARYIFPLASINVHGGYFDGRITQKLIFRLACLGYDGAVAAYKTEQTSLPDECQKHQIRLLRSKRLDHPLPREDMDLSEVSTA
ncbi:MAG TPA: hypothetical protein VGG86_19595 [Roseiarcus sp.]